MNANTFPVPLDFEELEPVVDLAARIGVDAAGLACMYVWRHRHVNGELIAGKRAADVLERAARWRRRRGGLVEALVGAGLVTESKEGLLIRDPFELVPRPPQEATR